MLPLPLPLLPPLLLQLLLLLLPSADSAAGQEWRARNTAEVRQGAARCEQLAARTEDKCSTLSVGAGRAKQQK